LGIRTSETIGEFSCGFRESGFLPMFGLALTVGAVASFLPNYHKIGKKFQMVIITNPSKNSPSFILD